MSEGSDFQPVKRGHLAVHHFHKKGNEIIISSPSLPPPTLK